MSNFAESQRPINVGLIGHGTVGREVADYFAQGFGERHNLQLKRVAVSDPSKHSDLPSSYLTGDYGEILSDPEIDLVVELMGRPDVARGVILDAIDTGKSIVTANKAALVDAQKGGLKTVFDATRDRGVNIQLEAAVGGGIPIVRTMLDTFQTERARSVQGILNGTTNYILTQMEQGRDLDLALREAQEKGFAEQDHRADTGGFDAAQKLAILASIGFNANITPDLIACSGIMDLSQEDFEFARSYRTSDRGNNYVIKLLAIANRTENGLLALRVEPALIRNDHPLASVRNENNGILVDGELVGQLALIGKGAGGKPTASAVLNDIKNVATAIRSGVPLQMPRLDEKVDIQNPRDHVQKGYFRTRLVDKDGSLAEVAAIIAGNHLGIEHSLQNGFMGSVEGDLEVKTDFMTLKKAPRDRIENARDALRESDRIVGNPVFIGFEE